MTVKAANLVRLDIANLAVGATSASLATPSKGSQLPDDLPYFITVWDRNTPDPLDVLSTTEIIRVDAHNKGAGTLDTIVRGQFGTTDQNHITGTPALIISPIAESTPSEYNIQEFGGLSSASGAVNSAAVVSALAAIKTVGKGILYIPAGLYSFANAIAVDAVPNLKIKGDGPGITILSFNDTDGIVIDDTAAPSDPIANSQYIEDLSISDVGTLTASKGIHFKANVINGGISRVRITGFGLNQIHIQGGEHLHFNEVYWYLSRVITGDLVLVEDGIGAGRIPSHHTWTACNSDRNESSGLCFHIKGVNGFHCDGLELSNSAGNQGLGILCENDGVEEFKGTFVNVHLRSGYLRANDFVFLNCYRPTVINSIGTDPTFTFDAAWSATLGYANADKRRGLVLAPNNNPIGTPDIDIQVGAIQFEDNENIDGSDGSAFILKSSQANAVFRNESDSAYINIRGKVLQAFIDGSAGGYKAGTSLDTHLYRDAANVWRTPDTFQIDRQLLLPPTSLTASSTNLDLTQNIILADASSNSVTLVLPTTPINGTSYTIKVIDNTNSIIIDPGTNTIDGSTADLILTALRQTVTLISDGTNWFITYLSDLGFKTLTSTDSPYSIVQGRDKNILVDTTIASVTVSLPEFPSPGEEYFIKKIVGGANDMIINTTGAPTIDGLSSRTTSTLWASEHVVSNGTDYFRISNN